MPAEIIHRQIITSKKFKNLTGQRFGKLFVIGIAERSPSGKIRFNCACDCGKTAVVHSTSLLSGHTGSCGCHIVELSKTMNKTHGMNCGRKPTAEYVAWQHIIRRCTNQNDPHYHNYGGRGIKICAGWRRSPDVFLESVGLRPTPNHSIDRVDNNGHYSCGKCDECLRNGWPFNVRWATREEQSRNKRSNINLTVGGVTKTVAEWSRERGILDGTIYRRAKKGWSDEDSVMTPVRKNQFC